MTTEMLDRLRVLWAEVLNVPAVAADDHFLDLGGDSIAATLCLNAVADEFDVILPMGLLLEDDTTFGAFAAAVDEARSATVPERSLP